MTKIFSCEKIRNKISLAFDHRLMNRTKSSGTQIFVKLIFFTNFEVITKTNVKGYIEKQ